MQYDASVRGDVWAEGLDVCDLDGDVVSVIHTYTGRGSVSSSDRPSPTASVLCTSYQMAVV